MNATRVKVPAIVLAYHLFMSGVGRLNQLLEGNSTAWRERRVPMFLSTFLFDASVLNGYVLYRSRINMDDVQESSCATMSLGDFTRRICEAGMTLHVAVRREKMILPPLNDAIDDSARENRKSDTSSAVPGSEAIAQHVFLSPLLEKERMRCHLCQLRKMKQNAQRCRTVCTTCNLGFPVDRHAAFHNSNLLRSVNHSVFCDLSRIREKNGSRNFRRRSASWADLVPTFCSIRLHTAVFHLRKAQMWPIFSQTSWQNLLRCEGLNANAACRRYWTRQRCLPSSPKPV